MLNNGSGTILGGAMDIEFQTADRLTVIARQYCDFIESLNVDNQPLASAELLKKLNYLLPRLHASIAIVVEVAGREGFADNIDIESRFSLFSQLRDILGEMDPYWMEFDVARDGQEMSGSLADDLTDIYWELKIGLQSLEQDEDLAPTLSSWGASYRLHWGQHLVDAERHLYSLQAKNMAYI